MYTLLSDSELNITISGPSSFWVVPAGVVVNCTEGCANCFFLAFGSSSGSNNMVVRIGFIFDANEMAEKIKNAAAAFWPAGSLGLLSNGEQDVPDTIGNDTAGESIGGSGDDYSFSNIALSVTPLGYPSLIADSVSCSETSCTSGWEQDLVVPDSSVVGLLIEGTAAATGSPMLRASWYPGYPGYPGPYRPYWRPPVWRQPVW